MQLGSLSPWDLRPPSAYRVTEHLVGLGFVAIEVGSSGYPTGQRDSHSSSSASPCCTLVLVIFQSEREGGGVRGHGGGGDKAI